MTKQKKCQLGLDFLGLSLTADQGINLAYPSQSALSSSVDKQPSVEINKSINVLFHTSLIKSGSFILTYAVPIIPINVCRIYIDINDVQTPRRYVILTPKCFKMESSHQSMMTRNEVGYVQHTMLERRTKLCVSDQEMRLEVGTEIIKVHVPLQHSDQETRLDALNRQ